jgi:hypothetical protein
MHTRFAWKTRREKTTQKIYVYRWLDNIKIDLKEIRVGRLWIGFMWFRIEGAGSLL